MSSPASESSKNISDIATLECVDLVKAYGTKYAISHLNVTIRSSFIGLLGPNGSGKSTLIKLMLGLIHPTSGQIRLGISKENMRVVPDFPNLPKHLTVDQWIGLLEEIYGECCLEEDVQSIFELDGTSRLGNLSAGQYRKAALLPLFYGKPQLIVLDEPTNFLDVVARTKVLRLIKRLITTTKCKVIMATHRLEEVRLFCEEVLILKEGVNVFHASLMEDTVIQYSLVVDDPAKLIAMLEEEGMVYRIEESVVGLEIVIHVSSQIWSLLERYTHEGGLILSFNAKEKLEIILEDLYQ